MFKKRNLYGELIEHLEYKEFSIIIGARQVGKTTVLKQLYSELKRRKEKVWFVSFEMPEVLSQINAHPENLFRYTEKPDNPLLIDSLEKVYILIDEIQYAENPTNFLKYLFDLYVPNLKIIATGSSAFYIDKKFKDSLAGRKKIFRLSTLNFEEYLYFKDQPELVEELEIIRQRKEYLSFRQNELMSLFDEYLLYGGYPAVVLFKKEKDKVDMLNELKNSYLKKDIDESRVENEDVFYKLLVALASQTGELLNKNELSKSLRTHSKTIEKYLYVLQKSFHVDLIKPYFSNLKKELVKMPKIYFNDLGLRNLLISNFSELSIRSDKGGLLENYVFLRLKNIYDPDNIRFWRTAEQNEVDFIVKQRTGTLNAFEVKFNSASIKQSKYKTFLKSYPSANMSFVCYTPFSEQENLQVLKL